MPNLADAVLEAGGTVYSRAASTDAFKEMLSVDSDGIVHVGGGLSDGLYVNGTLIDAAEVARVVDVSERLVNSGTTTLTLTTALHEGRIILLDDAAGVSVTLPAATGSGATYRFIVLTPLSGASYVINAYSNGADLVGAVTIIDTDTAGTVKGFATAAGDDGITLNGSTTGGVTAGEWIEVTDIAANVWSVRGQLSNTGDAATPFSTD